MFEFRLPALGADMDEGTLLEWCVQPGDTVKKGQVVAVVDTSKAAVDVEIWQAGTVHELLAVPGTRMRVGTVMASLLAEGEAPPAAAPRLRISPAARRRAAELGVDPATVHGTGAGGALTLADVEQAAARGEGPAPGAETGGAAERDLTVSAPRVPPLVPAQREAEIRRTIAAAMSRAKREIPHYYLLETIPLARADAWLTQANAGRPITGRLLMAVLLLKAVALALGKFPALNGFYRDGRFEPSAAVHPGVAISLRQGGLIAPALHDAGHKPLEVLMQELADLVRRARAGSLRSSEMSDPTVTVTNLGEQGAEAVVGVIYPPQVALVGFGRVDVRPWVHEDGSLGTCPAVVASLAADHRVSDGHYGARFLAELRALLQQPQALQAAQPAPGAACEADGEVR